MSTSRVLLVALGVALGVAVASNLGLLKMLGMGDAREVSEMRAEMRGLHIALEASVAGLTHLVTTSERVAEMLRSMHAELAWHREHESSPPDAKGRSALPTPGTSPPELTHQAVSYDQPGLGTVVQACSTWRNDENLYTCASVPLCCAGFKAKGDGPDQIHWHDCGIAVKALVATALFVGYPEHHRTPSVAQHPLLACCPPLCGPLLRQICAHHGAPCCNP